MFCYRRVAARSFPAKKTKLPSAQVATTVMRIPDPHAVAPNGNRLLKGKVTTLLLLTAP